MERDIPIITDEGLAYIIDYIRKNNVKKILEIGTAYGYSAICFSLENTVVDTFERDPERIVEAKKWVKTFNANVTIYDEDALLYEGLTDKYDLIFIDAAKSQYQKFFEKFKHNLNTDSAIICDNISFHQLKIEDVKNRNTKALLRKLEAFKTFLIENKDFDSIILPEVGDGLSVSKKK
ncbi:O-methyltransferase [Acholeplasma hippikon]|uniref:O-methyltransferase n=1 Tax=Acholeplasma hippikon TaxID=264636 RepID=UPI000AA90E3E|nr:class I SAM-dependent methyltransferase [Acholeplasma hippikon]